MSFELEYAPNVVYYCHPSLFIVYCCFCFKSDKVRIFSMSMMSGCQRACLGAWHFLIPCIGHLSKPLGWLWESPLAFALSLSAKSIAWLNYITLCCVEKTALPKEFSYVRMCAGGKRIGKNDKNGS